MTAKGYLLDTNIAIGIMDNEPQILSFISQTALEKQRIYLSVVTECEFVSGLASEGDIQQIPFLRSGRFLEVTSSIARKAGKIRREQRDKGRRIKTPDALILATAIEHLLVLVTRDRGLWFAQNEYDVMIHKL